jgi:FkbM family methyltransferase
MVKKLMEKTLIKIAKKLNLNLLAHAHVQVGVGHNSYFSGEEFIINTLLPKILKKEPTHIFDVGANVGNYANDLRRRYPKARISCFEPVPDNFKELNKNTENLNIDKYNFGFSDQKAELKLYSGSNIKDGSMATLYPECFDSIFQFVGEVDQGTTCKFETLDDFTLQNQIENIDFLKIDVEGHELSVLLGAKNMLLSSKVAVIQFEFNEFNIISKTFMKDFYNLLKEYQFFRIMPQNKLFSMGEYNSNHEIFRYQNILAIHQSLNFKNDR